MKVITGKKFNTSFGTIITIKDPQVRVTRGDFVMYEGSKYRVTGIIPPTKPEDYWSVIIE